MPSIDVPWDIAADAGRAFRQVPGRRTAKARLVNAYMPRLHAAARDPALAAALIPGPSPEGPARMACSARTAC